MKPLSDDLRDSSYSQLLSLLADIAYHLPIEPDSDKFYEWRRALILFEMLAFFYELSELAESIFTRYLIERVFKDNSNTPVYFRFSMGYYELSLRQFDGETVCVDRTIPWTQKSDLESLAFQLGLLSGEDELVAQALKGIEYNFRDLSGLDDAVANILAPNNKGYALSVSNQRGREFIWMPNTISSTRRLNQFHVLYSSYVPGHDFITPLILLSQETITRYIAIFQLAHKIKKLLDE